MFQEFLYTAFSHIADHLKLGGAFYIWHADLEGYNFRVALQRAGLNLKQCLIWNKNSLVLGRQDYQWKHEPCLYGWKDGAAHYFTSKRNLTTVIEDDFNIDALTKDELKHLLTQILNLPSTVFNENKPLRNGDHPTMKPIPLIGKQISNSTRIGETVLDVFGGSGSTLIACEQLKRKCRIMEFDPIYADVIIRRWEELTGETAEYVGNCLNNTDL